MHRDDQCRCIAVQNKSYNYLVILSKKKKINHMVEHITEDYLLKMFNYCKLDDEQCEIVQKQIRNAKIQKKMIRDILCEEGKLTKKAFFLLEGHVNINATLFNGERIVLSQVGKQQFLNLELVLNSWINKYTITVTSSYIKYITFDEKQIKILTQHIIPELQQKANLKQKQINKRNKLIRQENKKKKLEENINKLILPDINQHNKKRSIINIDSNQTEQILSIKQLPMFSKELRKQGRSSSLSKLKSTESRYSSQPIGLYEKNMEAINQNLLDRLHEKKDKIIQNKLERLKSERSISLNEKQLKQIDYSRNEKLFKEHLKNIVKRKLLFERKHFKILKNFKNQKKQLLKQDEIIRRYEENPDNPIDNYFML